MIHLIFNNNNNNSYQSLGESTAEPIARQRAMDQSEASAKNFSGD